MYSTLAVCLTAVCLLAGCDGMDETYKEFLDDGPVIYVGKVDSAKVLAGKNRVGITWNKQTDPRAKTAKIFWENKKKSLEVALDRTQGVFVVVDDLEQGSYVFDIYTYDNYGNRSVKVEAIGNVYDESYEKTLTNRILEKATKVSGNLILTFKPNANASLLETEVVYMNSGEEEQTVLIDNTETTYTIEGYSAGFFRYRTAYIPEPGAIDKFYSQSDDYQTP